MRVERESSELSREANRYHQQYLFKNPNGYCGIGGTDVKLGDPCGIGGTGVTCPVGLTSGEA